MSVLILAALSSRAPGPLVAQNKVDIPPAHLPYGVARQPMRWRLVVALYMQLGRCPIVLPASDLRSRYSGDGLGEGMREQVRVP